MFTAALFTVAQTWKRPQCPLPDEWIKRCVYVCVHPVDSYLAINTKKRNLPFVTTWMDPEGVVLSGVSQRKTNTV